MTNETYALRLLTPCFNGGAEPNSFAELRTPSIRGKIRWWFDKSTPTQDVQQLFGGIAGTACRSSVTFRLAESSSSQLKVSMLPHKNQGVPRPALPPQDFDLICRCQDETFAEVDRAVRIWVLLGTIGARGNRAAGSVWFREGAPNSVTALRDTLAGFNLPHAWDIQIAPVDSFDRGRSIASDTVKGVDHLLGGISPRKDSPIKFKVLELGGTPHLLIFAPVKDMWSKALDALQSPLGGGPAKPLCNLSWESVV